MTCNALLTADGSPETSAEVEPMGLSRAGNVRIQDVLTADG
jgi:hypothetical protein